MTVKRYVDISPHPPNFSIISPEPSFTLHLLLANTPTPSSLFCISLLFAYHRSDDSCSHFRPMHVPPPSPPLTLDGKSENHNYCNSCGAAGFLLCCDGCERSFHFTCLDPPLTADASELDEPWFCHTCIVRRDGPNKAAQGLFSGLLNNLEKRNPVNYTLPANIREYFDGVATGKDGKFAEPTNAKTR